MALATQCPHCLTTFRVAADQLKLRGGIVRCGACQSIFDGSAHLIELDKPAPPPAVPASAPAPTPAAAPAPDVSDVSDTAAAPSEDDALPVYTLDFSQSFEPLGILPNVAVPTPDAPRARVWRTGTPAQAPAAAETPPAVPMPAPTLDGGPSVRVPETAPAAAPTGMQDAAQTALHAAPDTAPAAPPADAYAPAGRVAPRLEPAAGTAADAPAPAFHTGGAEPEPAPLPAAPSAPVSADAYAPAGRIEPNFGLPVDEEIVARALPDSDPEPEAEPAPPPPADTGATTAPAALPRPASTGAGADDDVPPAALPLRASAASESTLPAIVPTVPPARSKTARASEARARRSKLTPTKIEPPKLRIAADADADEPEFVKRSRRLERTDRMRRLLMIAGTVVLAFGLLAQVVLGWRNVLAQQHPGLKPVLAGACAVLGCRVELPALADNLVIETGELTTLGPNTYALNTLLRNQGSLVLAWPSIELELTDAADRPVLRRVLAPADYLPAGTSAAAGFGPHTEQPVTLHFTLAGLQPSGYHTFVFYP